MARVLLLEEPAAAAHGPAGADAGHEGVERPAGLFPDLRGGELLVRLDVVGVVVLVQVEAVGRLGGDAPGHRVVALRRLGRHVGGRHDHLGAEGLERVLLLLRHLVRHREDAAVALDGRGQRHPHPGVAAGVLDDGAARLEQPGPLRLLDDVERHAVLDGAARVQVLELDQHRGGPGPDHLAQLDEGGVADRGEDVLVVGHGRAPRQEVRALIGVGRGGVNARPRRRGGHPVSQDPVTEQRVRDAVARATGARRPVTPGEAAGRPRLDAELLAGRDAAGLPGGDGDAGGRRAGGGDLGRAAAGRSLRRRAALPGRARGAGAGHPRLRGGRGADGARGPRRRDAGDPAAGRRRPGRALPAGRRPAGPAAGRAPRRARAAAWPSPAPSRPASTAGSWTTSASGCWRPGRAAVLAAPGAGRAGRLVRPDRGRAGRRAARLHPPRLPVAQPDGAAGRRAGGHRLPGRAAGAAPVRPGGAAARQLRRAAAGLHRGHAAPLPGAARGGGRAAARRTGPSARPSTCSPCSASSRTPAASSSSTASAATRASWSRSRPRSSTCARPWRDARTWRRCSGCWPGTSPSGLGRARAAPRPRERGYSAPTPR